MQIEWNTLSRNDWSMATQDAPWEQTWAYGAAITGDRGSVHRAAIMDGGDPIGLA